MNPITFKKCHFNRSLPTEIKSMIFKEVCRVTFDSETYYLNSTFWGIPRPTKLRLVCRSWRDIVDNTPEVWCTIIIHFRRIPSHDSMKQYFNMYLERSKNVPLSIYLGDMRSIEKKLTLDELLCVFDDVMKISKRISHLFIHGTGRNEDEFAEKFYQLTLADFPILKNVIFMGIDVFYPEDDNCYDRFENSPQLRMVTMSYMYYHSSVFKCFTQITELRLRSVSLEQCADVFWFIPQLQCLTLDDVPHDHEERRQHSITFPDGKSKSIVRHSLISLKIDGVYDRDLVALFKCIVCPALKHLDVTSFPHNVSGKFIEVGLMESIETLLEISSCALHTLRIHRITIGDLIWPLLDKVHATIENLELVDHGFIGKQSILTSLFNKLHSTTYLPLIQQLTINESRSRDYDYNLILQVLTARRNATSSFAAFKANMDRACDTSLIPDPAVVEGFNQLIRDGMKISFVFQDDNYLPETKKFREEFIDKLLLR